MLRIAAQTKALTFEGTLGFQTAVSKKKKKLIVLLQRVKNKKKKDLYVNTRKGSRTLCHQSRIAARSGQPP